MTKSELAKIKNKIKRELFKESNEKDIQLCKFIRKIEELENEKQQFKSRHENDLIVIYKLENKIAQKEKLITILVNNIEVKE